MDGTANILVIDDDPVARDLLQRVLSAEGHTIRVAHDGAEGLSAARAQMPDLVLTDWWMPDMDGTEVVRQIRADESLASLPVIMVTTSARAEDIAFAFEVGADDYVIKPFREAELVGRVRAILRVRRPRRTPTPPPQGPLHIDSVRHEVLLEGEPLELTATEFSLLECLMAHPGVAMPRRKLLDEAIAPGVHVTERTIDVHVRRIRKKLGKHASVIETIRGVGYRARDDLP